MQVPGANLRNSARSASPDVFSGAESVPARVGRGPARDTGRIGPGCTSLTHVHSVSVPRASTHQSCTRAASRGVAVIPHAPLREPGSRADGRTHMRRRHTRDKG